MFDALYVINDLKQAVLLYSLTATSLPLSSIVNYADEKEPVIEISPSHILYKQKHSDLTLLLLCAPSVDILLPFEFLERVVIVLESYFSPPLVSSKIISNYDTTTLILSEMLDGDTPFVTEHDAIRDQVPVGGMLSKFLGNSSSKKYEPAPTPWRRSGVRHTNNELFFDFVEKFRCVIPPLKSSIMGAKMASIGLGMVNNTSRTTRVLSQVEGSIFFTSHLSGVPEIALELALNRHKIQNPSFHPSVNVGKWQKSPGYLSFIPPDGKSLIMSYTLDDINDNIVYAELFTGIGSQFDEFEVRITTTMNREVKSIDKLSVSIPCPANVSGVKDVKVSRGDYSFDKGTIDWNFSKVPLGWNASLRGRLVESRAEDDEVIEREGHKSPHSEYTKLFPVHVEVNYQLSGRVTSGIKVQSLRITSSKGLGEGVRPYKGVRYVTHGEVSVR